MTAQRVTNMIPPRNAVGYLAMQWNTGTWFYGSAALINSTNILTCSHNLVDQVTQPIPGVAQAVRFYPAYNQSGGGNPPPGGLEVSIGFYSTAYAAGQDAWDVAVCRLRNAYTPQPPAYFVPTATGAEIVGHDVILTGYPGFGDGEMWEDVDQVFGVDVSTNTLIYTHDTWAGNSGSPTWTYDSISDVVRQHGIHVSVSGGTDALRRGVLITTAVRDWISAAVSLPSSPAPFHLQGF